MKKQKLNRKLLLGFVSILLLLLLFVPTACTMTGDTELIEGILQNIDDIKGEITILTEDGQEITIKITSDNTENDQSSEGGDLEVGSPIKVSIDKCDIVDTKILKEEKPSTDADLATILPSLNSSEDVFKTLGVWEDAHALREKGLSWSHVAGELGYNKETMYAELREIIEERLHHAKELGLINYDRFKYKFNYFSELALKWVTKIFADVEEKSSMDVKLADILPSLNCIEDVFKTLGVWEDAHALREKGLSWSHVAGELGYNKETMYAELQEIIEERLHHAKELGLIDYDQFKYKFNYFSELALKWVTKIFADVEEKPSTNADLATILPSLNSIEDVFKTLGVWEDAHALREKGLSWSHVAGELGYNKETMYAELQEIIEERLHHAKELGLINYDQFKYKFNYFSELALKWVTKIFSE